ncbi:hypothetical protein Chor_011534 [Crotalus horridus]
MCQMLLLLHKQLFLLQLLSQIPCAYMLMKCPLKVIIEEKEWFHYYKPGDYLITGIMSGIVSRLYQFSFSKPPTHQLKSHNLEIIIGRISSGTIPEANMKTGARDTLMQEKWEMFLSLIKSQIKIIVCQLDFKASGILISVIQELDKSKKFIVGRVWIATTLTALSVGIFDLLVDLQNKHALFSFLIQTKGRIQYYDFKSYTSMVTVYGKEAFQCSISSPLLSKKVWKKCKEKENWEFPPHDVIARILSQCSSGISKVIQNVTWVLSAASSSQQSKRRMQVGYYESSQIVQPWQLHRFLRNFQLHNISRDGIYFDENGVPLGDFDIMHWTSFWEKSDAGVKTGSVEREGSSEVKISINQSAIQWPTSFNKVADAAWSLLFYLPPYVQTFLLRNNTY